MDIERVRYSLIKYHRIRILKIEKMFRTILSTIELLDRLSKDEKIYLTKLSNLHNTYYEESFFNRLSENIKESVENSEDCLKQSQVNFSVSLLHYVPVLNLILVRTMSSVVFSGISLMSILETALFKISSKEKCLLPNILLFENIFLIIN
jgi:hypothetical protein